MQQFIAFIQTEEVKYVLDSVCILWFFHYSVYPGIQQVRPVSASALSTLTQSGAIRTAVPRAGTITVQRQKSPLQQGAVRIIQQGTGASGATQVINLGSGANIMSGTKTITVSYLPSQRFYLHFIFFWVDMQEFFFLAHWALIFIVLEHLLYYS